VKVVVTGSSGKIGRRAFTALTGSGHRAIGFDTKPSPDGHRTVPVDCTDLGQVMDALSGIDTTRARADAVIHLAGIPAPGLAPDASVFTDNTVSVYNIFTACARLGIPRVVWASSETILGLPFTTPPDYLPLDENHPARPEWHYSLGKQVGEVLADAFVRWHPAMSIVSLRFSNVFETQDYSDLATIQSNPASRKLNVWAYVDADDAGRACLLAATTAITGHERVIVAAADTIMDTPTTELVQRYFPGVAQTAPLDGYTSLLSSTRAANLIGYQPQISWRQRLGQHG
jgi:nucleoside-diphosphate-sugar epimerase